MTNQLNTNELISGEDLKCLNDLSEKIQAASQAAALLYMTENPLLSVIARDWARQTSQLRADIKNLASALNDLD